MSAGRVAVVAHGADLPRTHLADAESGPLPAGFAVGLTLFFFGLVYAVLRRRGGGR